MSDSTLRTRDYRCVTLFGAPASGKTSLVDQYVREAVAEGRRVIVVDPQRQFPDGSIPGVTRVWEGSGRMDDWMADQLARDALRGCLLVLDDEDRYMDAHLPKGNPWRDLLISFRHYQVDVVGNSRNPQGVPKLQLACSSHIAIFRIRGYRSKKAIEDELDSPELVSRIPHEPYRYLLVDVDQGTGEVYATRKRQIQTAADS